MAIITLPEAKRYGPIGQCIYCGSTADGTKLTDEHIIPLAINGSLILPQASCGACAGIINKQFETAFLQETVIDARAHLKMKSRSKRRNKSPPPSERPGRIARYDDEGRFLSWQTVGRQDHPFLYIGIVLEPPTFLTNQTPKPGINAHAVNLHFDQKYYERSSKIDGRWGLVQMFTPDGLCREIAKIAHGAAVAELGIGGFEPFLPSLILGQQNTDLIFHYVGGALEPNARHGSATHSISLSLLGKIVVASVRLFANLGGPTYVAVVGKTKLT